MLSPLQAQDATPLLTIFLIIIPLLSLFMLSTIFRKQKPYPPGPKGWPLIGNMTMMDQLTHRGLAKLAVQHGGIFHLRMGFLHIIAVSSPDVARQILQVHDNVFSNRPANTAVKYLTYGRADLAFAHYGPFWRQMRKLCVMKLFSRRQAESSWEAVRDEVEGMLQSVAGRVGSVVNIGELVFGLTRSIVYRAAFGSRSREGEGEFIKILQEFSELFGAFNVADFIPGLGWLDPQGLNTRLAKARAKLDGFIDAVIDDHVQKKEESNGFDGPSDMVDELLAYVDNDAEEKNVKLTRDNIKAVIMDVMFGGTETVASAIEWTMAELMKRPEDLKKVQQELTTVVGLDRHVEESDLEKLTYLQCCLKEALRLHPPIPILLHETAEDAEISGYHIPARSRVMINVWAIGRDECAWQNADEFKPERFLIDGAPDFKGRNFEFITFGSGRRSCPGMQLGLYGLEMAVAHLLHCFTWELEGELDMSDVFGLAATRTSRLVAVPSPRLHAHVELRVT